jgi:hypothetical protein
MLTSKNVAPFCGLEAETKLHPCSSCALMMREWIDVLRGSTSSTYSFSVTLTLDMTDRECTSNVHSAPMNEV